MLPACCKRPKLRYQIFKVRLGLEAQRMPLAFVYFFSIVTNARDGTKARHMPRAFV